jgi:cell division protein FtsB
MKKKRVRFITAAVILALVVYAGISLAAVKRQTSQAEAKRAELERQVEEKQKENTELQYDLDHAGDEDILEGQARDLGLVKPNEIIFYDSE